ncbi:DUF4168 domain-containing protein [Celerinatantimonas yamalensis]|uniref:DUF4168 domain-containing protein n=1 Tax=Celerinatantimonas yamalensis TaxID=559956 RepID=A0ABW9GA40_9GAMM
MKAAFKSAIALAFGICTITTSMATYAKTPSHVTQSNQAKPTASHFSNTQLKKFAKASHQLAQISHQAMSQLNQTKDQAKQKKIRQRTEQKMVSVVRQDGLSVKAFNQIGLAARKNPQLQKKLQQLTDQ